MIKHKIHIVPDSICEGCFQNYENECRAFQVPQSIKEDENRDKGGAKCILNRIKEKGR